MKRKMINRLKKWRALRPLFTCPNCGEKTRDGHYVPPGFGEPGAFICAEKGAK